MIKFTWKVVIFMALAVFLVWMIFLSNQTAKNEIVGGNIYSKQVVELSAATTSPTLLAPNATWRGYVPSATLQADVRDVEDLRLNIAYKASTTRAALNWNYYWSGNGVDWYEESITSNSGNTTTHATGTTQTWNMDNLNTNYKSILLSDVSAPHFKVVFDAVTATGSLYAELVKRGN